MRNADDRGRRVRHAKGLVRQPGEPGCRLPSDEPPRLVRTEVAPGVCMSSEEAPSAEVRAAVAALADSCRSIMGQYVIGADGEGELCEDTIAWARWFGVVENRRLRRDLVGEFAVSTVFLGLDHNFCRQGPPLLWETMIFDRQHHAVHDYQERYSTREEALAGHARAVELARAIQEGTMLSPKQRRRAQRARVRAAKETARIRRHAIRFPADAQAFYHRQRKHQP